MELSAEEGQATKPDVWVKETWHQIIEESDDQFEALSGMLRSLYQQAFELAMIELRKELTADILKTKAIMEKQNELLKNVIKYNGEMLDYTKGLYQVQKQL